MQAMGCKFYHDMKIISAPIIHVFIHPIHKQIPEKWQCHCAHSANDTAAISAYGDEVGKNIKHAIGISWPLSVQ